MKNIILGLFFILGVSTVLAQKTTPKVAAKLSKDSKTATAVFAGGCFWCMEPPFDKLPGVISTTSGFAGGLAKNPSYKKVSSGQTKHVEAVLVVYDPKKVSYRKLVDTYWHQIDPTDGGGSFVDRGPHYRPVIYFKGEAEKKSIAESLQALKAKKLYKKPIVVEVTPFTTFYPAEDYHQDYYKKNPIRYKYYRFRSGRDQYIKKIWGSK